MIISFSPQRRDGALTLARSGDTLVVNGDVVDLSVVPDGATLPAAAIDSEWIAGDVHRIDGVLHVTVLLPHGPHPAGYHFAPPAMTDPANGPIALPAAPAFEEPDHGDD